MNVLRTSDGQRASEVVSRKKVSSGTWITFILCGKAWD